MDDTSPLARFQPLIFHSLGLLGFLQTWGRNVADGTVTHLLKALHAPGGHVLPGTDTAMLRPRFTGVPFPVDYLLRMLVLFFWEAAHGCIPAVSATGLYFLGQVFAIMMTAYLDSVRGSRASAKPFKASAWLFLFQMTGIASTGGLWVLDFNKTSPTVSTTQSLEALQRASLISPVQGVLVLVGMVVGYAIPGGAMGLRSPTFVSYDFQQWAIVIWNVYPIWVYLFVKAGSALFDPSPAAGPGKSQPLKTSKQGHLYAVRLVGLFTVVASFATHVGVAAVSLSTVLFPPMFQAPYRTELNPVSLATPPWSRAQTRTVGDGIHGFMLWDQVFGYTFGLAVMAAQLRPVLRLRGSGISRTKAIALCALSCFVIGPGTTCMAMSWLRDELLFGSEIESSGKVE